MLMLAQTVAVKVATHAHSFLPAWFHCPPLNAPGLKEFPFLIGAALLLLGWCIFFYDPGSASPMDKHKDN